jgi:hypothetical protein
MNTLLKWICNINQRAKCTTNLTRACSHLKRNPPRSSLHHLQTHFHVSTADIITLMICNLTHFYCTAFVGLIGELVGESFGWVESIFWKVCRMRLLSFFSLRSPTCTSICVNQIICIISSTLQKSGFSHTLYISVHQWANQNCLLSFCKSILMSK